MIERYDLAKCKACGRCIEVCPMDVFRAAEEDGKPRPVYPDDCQTCFNCELECPTGAITISPFTHPSKSVWDPPQNA
ncbi:MAG: 4Fe-4S dicluster domain-containing protein [Candidatus Geothermincolia bacterium]